MNKYYLHIRWIACGEFIDACVSQEKKIYGWTLLAASEDREDLEERARCILGRNP
jgi:hypothetical protein